MKKLISFALVLVMCFALAVAVSAESFNNRTNEKDKPVEITIYKTAKAPTLDGVINADEWGDAIFSAVPTAPEKNSMVPEKVEYWMCYDENNLYLALRATTDYYKAGGNKVGSYLIPRFPVAGGSNYRGLLAVSTANAPMIDGQFGKGAQLKIEYKDGVVSYEVIIPKAIVEADNTGAAGKGAILKEGEVWSCTMEYCDQVLPHNASAGDANDGKMFTYTDMKITIGVDKPAAPAAPATPVAPSTPATPSAPATFDAGVIALVVAAAAGAGVVVSKKRR